MATADYADSVGDVDIIFAGGGTAACVTAGRLAKAYPDLKILLVEAGRTNDNDPTVVNAGAFLTLLDPKSKTTFPYRSQPSPHLLGREALVANGCMLGRGSLVNYMMDSRAQGIDFDDWDTPGWAAKDMLPVCNKLETFHCAVTDRSKHGYEGPVHISDGGFRSNVIEEFMNSIKKMGYKEIEDLQDFDHIGGFSRCHRNVSLDGKRQDAAYQYIHPLLQDGRHPNLHLLLQTRVLRVIFYDSKLPRAIGVECRPNPDLQPELAISTPKFIRARKFVVLAAGALSTPQILERSGVGNQRRLNKLGIHVVSDLRGVGENYQDHNHVMYPYKTSLDASQCFDGCLSSSEALVRAQREKDPKIGWNGVDICAKLRPADDEIAAFGPEFQRDWNRDFASKPTRPLLLCGVMNAFLPADASKLKTCQCISIGTYTAYPWSRGSIHITNKEDVIDGYEFNAGFLSHPSDIKTQICGYKVTRGLARGLPYFRGEVKAAHPQFKENSRARVTEFAQSTVPMQEIAYSKEDNEAIEDWIRTSLSTTWHSLGTCAMTSKSRGGVVDRHLNVYGTQGLKVVDLSIVPTNVGANTNNTAFAVGEKAAMIIDAEMRRKVAPTGKL
ncbi:MAG: hypothetical protein M1818_002485 [Claussenomyces sp. TS43310]|nr:MAG: hypothetical protein M1818_002485 [Claussenomyces sp. TS43310]